LQCHRAAFCYTWHLALTTYVRCSWMYGGAAFLVLMETRLEWSYHWLSAPHLGAPFVFHSICHCCPPFWTTGWLSKWKIFGDQGKWPIS
jgi:hypothetical protein